MSPVTATATFLPHISFSFAFLFILVGVAGTTISPYMFFWQASEEVEEEIEDGIDKKTGHFETFIRNMRIDNALGMFISEFITWCIIHRDRDGVACERRHEHRDGIRCREGARALGA